MDNLPPIVGEAEEFLPDCPDEYISLPDPTDEIKVVSHETEHSPGLGTLSPTPSDSMTGKLAPDIAVEKLVDALSHLPTKLKLATSKDSQGLNSLDICTSILNSGAKEVLCACKESEIKAQQVLDRAQKEKFDEKQTMDAMKEVMNDTVRPWMIALDKFNKELEVGMEPNCKKQHVTNEQLHHLQNYLLQMANFIIELLLWTWEILKVIAIESHEGKTEKRNAMSAFLRAMNFAFQQSNFVDLMGAVHTSNVPLMSLESLSL